MLKGSDAEVKTAAKELVSHRLFFLMLIAIPVVGIPDCALGVNQQERAEQRNVTGLRIIAEKLDAAEIFINFDYEVTKSWGVLLDKFSSGRLEVPSGATEFPRY